MEGVVDLLSPAVAVGLMSTWQCETIGLYDRTLTPVCVKSLLA
jgi:hypothetical protein